MRLPPFELHRPQSVAEASALLERLGDDAALYCGGTELLLLMKLGFAGYGHLVDVKGLEELRGIEAENGTLRLGAATTHRQVERSPLVRERWPALARMERNVANVRVRTAGSLGGNLCFSDPHSDPATFLLAADAELVCRRGDARRAVPIREFVLGPYQTVLAEGELLTEIRLPELPRGAAAVHKKLAFHERPAATVTCLVRVENGAVAEARVAVGSVGVVPVRVPEAERLLRGLPLDGASAAAIEEAGEAAAEASRPVADSNGSPEYKRNLVRVLLRRCFAEALAQTVYP